MGKESEHAITEQLIVTGDKGYISKTQQISLFETARIQLEVPIER